MFVRFYVCVCALWMAVVRHRSRTPSVNDKIEFGALKLIIIIYYRARI